MNGLPSRITGIVASPRRAGRFVVEVDGRQRATLALDAIERLRLAVGQPFDPVAELVEREAAALATYDRALNMLAVRARSARELRRQLVAKGEPADDVDRAIERLVAAGLLDDAAYARQFSRSKVLGAGLARRRLQQELFKRGVAREVADEAIDEVLAEEEVDELAVVVSAARKKVRSLARLDAPTRRRRLYGYLARRGYEPDAIREAMRRVLEGGEGEAAAEAIAEATDEP